jgi:uncharacterized membrane protein YkvI
MDRNATFFQRYLLPGLAFKAVVIGGGYATGRELVEFFLPSGPVGGLFGMTLAMVLWSVICTVTFIFARATQSSDYRTFFQNLLGPCWILFDLCNVLFSILILSVFGAAAGAIGHAIFGWPEIAGTLALIFGISFVAAFGSEAVERLFSYVSVILYSVYAIFLILAIYSFGDLISASFAKPLPTSGWLLGGVTYAGYNVTGAILILPVIRHLTSTRDAVIAGALCGPLAMIPAMIFFICMTAFFPQIGSEALPSNYILERLNFPLFQLIFQFMIFSALLESSTGIVHAINERLTQTYVSRDRIPPKGLRVGATLTLLLISIFVADEFGLIALISNGYRFLSWVFLTIYVLPLMTFGVWRLWSLRQSKLRTETCPAAL